MFVLSVFFFYFVFLFSLLFFYFFFSSRRRHTRCLSDWSSDVCSSDLVVCRRRCRMRAVASWRRALLSRAARRSGVNRVATAHEFHGLGHAAGALSGRRSEERRVGKECRSRWSPEQ